MTGGLFGELVLPLATAPIQPSRSLKAPGGTSFSNPSPSTSTSDAVHTDPAAGCLDSCCFHQRAHFKAIPPHPPLAIADRQPDRAVLENWWTPLGSCEVIQLHRPGRQRENASSAVIVGHISPHGDFSTPKRSILNRALHLLRGVRDPKPRV